MEISIRLLGIVVASGLLYIYTGWISAWIWSISILLGHAVYFLFLRSRKDRATHRDETISGVLFLYLLVAFLWMPGLMITTEDRALTICGGVLVGCILVFLIRRSDTTPIMIYGEVIIVATFIIVVFLQLIPQVDDVFAKAGLLGSGIALLFYFAEAARMSRKQKTDAAKANLRALQTEKMAAIGRLAGGVAHDFNNNLTAILGHLELMALLEDPQEQKASISEATLAAQQATRTVKQLLAFARKDRLELAPQDGKEILESVVTLTRRLIPVSVRLRILYGDRQQRFVADRGQLISALINLVVNAVDAMPKGGEIKLSSTLVDLKTPLDLADGTRLARGAYVRISITDGGHGIPEELISKVLEPFFTTKPVGKGTGLGLPMAFGMSKELGGGMTIASSREGTTVSIFLPEKPQGSAEAQREADKASAKRRAQDKTSPILEGIQPGQDNPVTAMHRVAVALKQG